jgi:hypothetical protein
VLNLTLLLPSALMRKSMCVCMHYVTGHTMALAVSFFLWRPGWFSPRPVHVGFVMDEVALGQVFPCYYLCTSAPYAYFIHVPLYTL